MDNHNRYKDIAQDIVDNIWDLAGHYPFNSVYLYDYVLYILYGFHKNYSIKVHDNKKEEKYEFLFQEKGDALLNDLYRYIKEKNPAFKSREFSLFSQEFIKVLLNYNHDVFDACYFEILHQLSYKIAINSGSMEFITPDPLNKLISYFVKKEGCNSVYDPFCGSASILHYLYKENNNLSFVGQDQFELPYFMARLNAEAYSSSEIIHKNSIEEWNKSHFDAIASCPPFAVPISAFRKQWIDNEYDDLNRTLEEILFSRAFHINNASFVAVLQPLAFCQAQLYKRLRKYLVDNNYIDTIIFLPDKLLLGTGVNCVLVLCKKNRKDSAPIKLIDAQSYFIGDTTKTREFDYESFVRNFETNPETLSSYADPQEVASCDYNLNLYLYSQRTIELKEGQKMVSFDSLMTVVQKERVLPTDVHKVFPNKNFSQDFISVLLNKDKVIPSSEDTSLSPRRLVKVKEGKKYLLSTGVVRSSKPRYALYTKTEDFSCSSDIAVFEINEDIINAEYLVYLLVNSPVLRTGNFLSTHISRLHTAIDSPDNQKEIVGKLKQQHAATERAEQEADAKRLGVKTNISDLEHMLGTTYANIDDVIYKLGKIHSEDDSLRSLLKDLKDNVEYLKRVIKYDNANISVEEFNLKEQDIEVFIQSYCEGWNNYSGRYFRLSLQVNLDGHNIVEFDNSLFKVMLDSILTNVERHGFDKRRNDANRVKITLDLENYEERPYVVLRVANNGAPFRSGFTIDDYITRGRYSASSGRSGLGGYHVYQIVKGHKGFLYLDSNKIWNVIVEVLLPIENVKTDNLVEYEHECI